MQILQDITTSAALLQAGWNTLSKEEIAGLIKSGQVIKDPEWFLNMEGKRGKRIGKYQYKNVFYHVTPATETSEEILVEVYQTEMLDMSMFSDEVTDTLKFGFSRFLRITEQVVALNDGVVPTIEYEVKASENEKIV